MIQPTAREIAEALHQPEFLSATVIDSGQNNRIFDTGKVIVRIPRHDEARRDLAREADVLAVLAPMLPVPVPAPELRNVGAYVVAVHRKLPGEPLLSLDGMTAAQAQELARDLALFLCALHALPQDMLRDAALADPMAEWRDLLERLEAKALPLLPAAVANSIRNSFIRFLGRVPDAPRTITHGDFGTGNILVDKGRVSGVIDFAGCGAGDPAYDLASLSAGLGDDVLALMAPHYSGIAGMRDRITFYRSTFPLLDVLFGVDHGDAVALDAGLRSLTAGNVPA
ncbi:phosphotransferase family protein [Aminobacter ciceronei]|jgi:aminoglycoside 2''-phosphotransferase|uniref:phosphotransferase family protein n=1 Tax=Aminobacter ciceronei TaxID=150723 RepID=UPI003F6E668C